MPTDAHRALGLAVLCTCLSVALPAAGRSEARDAPHAHPVLPPTAATEVARLLDLDRPLADGLRLRADIQSDHVLVAAGPADAPTLAVTLVHPDRRGAGEPRVGDVALRTQPGPASEAHVAALVARIRAAKGVLTWRRPGAAQRPQPAASGRDDGRAALLAAMVRASSLRAAGDPAGAQRALATVPTPTDPEPRLAYAVAWLRAGQARRAAEIAAGFNHDAPASVRAVATALLGKPMRPADALAMMGTQLTCADAGAAAQFHLLGHDVVAVAVAAAVRRAVPTCGAAWAAELHARGDLRADAVSAKAAADALAILPSDASVLDAAASMARRHHDIPAAIARYERLAHLAPKRPGTLGHLTNALMHKDADRRALLARYEARVAADPRNDVDRFVLAVLLHYADDYARSNAEFTALGGRRDAEDRLHVYTAMNDFNLGDSPAALARLDRLAATPRPDPDVFYCRAEIERDADRPKAIADLRRYLASSSGKDASHAVKEARVRRMIALLQACIGDGRPVCEGPWEHPRAQRRLAASERLRRRLVLGGGGLLVLLAIGWGWRRRRRRAVSA